MTELPVFDAYINRNNLVQLSLKSDGLAVVHNLITRAQLQLATTVLDSQPTPALFDLTKPDRLIFKPKDCGLSLGKHTATVITYDVDNPDGFVWGRIILNVQ